MKEKVCISPLATRPVLYTDTVGGSQTCRDDLWAVTTDELNALELAAGAARQGSNTNEESVNLEAFEAVCPEVYTDAERELLWKGWQLAGQSQATKVQAVLEGFTLLPIKPTPEMIEAGNNVSDLYRMGRPELWGDVYRSMIAAAPQPPTAQEVTQQAAPGPLKDWHDAVLTECMRVDGCYHANDPAQTLTDLLNWHIQNERDIGGNILAVERANFVCSTCASSVVTQQAAKAETAEPVGETSYMPGTDGFTMACFKASEVPVGTKLYIAPTTSTVSASDEIRNAALEEAAKVCDEMEQHYSDYKDTALLNGDVDLSNAASGEPRACRFIAAAIRSLRTTSPNKGEAA
jgi:hypothetical protein